MAFIRQLAVSTCALWGENSVVCHLADRYQNVFNSLQGDARYPIDIALRAYQKCGITPAPVAMRGGYDGAVLSQKDCRAQIFSPVLITSIQFMSICRCVPYGLPAMSWWRSLRKRILSSRSGELSHDSGVNRASGYRDGGASDSERLSR